MKIIINNVYADLWSMDESFARVVFANPGYVASSSLDAPAFIPAGSMKSSNIPWIAPFLSYSKRD